MIQIREPVVAGSFYPSSAEALKREIQGFLAQSAPSPVDGEIIGLVVPHAGYMYSGAVAAAGYKALINREIKTAVVIAPSHRVYFEGASVMTEGAYRTPLGLVKIDEELARDIVSEDSLFSTDVRPHLNEHALEVQVPFLQVAGRDVRIVPVIMGSQTSGTVASMTRSLADVLRKRGEGIVCVASTDLSHYHPYEEAVEMDGIALNHLKRFDVAGLARDFTGDRFEAFGGGPMLVVMMVCRELGADRSVVLSYMNSGDVTGDKSAVVGYVSAVFCRSRKPGSDEE